MKVAEAKAIIRELKMLMEALCSRELNHSGREYVKRRIQGYEDRIVKAGTSGDDRDTDC